MPASAEQDANRLFASLIPCYVILSSNTLECDTLWYEGIFTCMYEDILYLTPSYTYMNAGTVELLGKRTRTHANRGPDFGCNSSLPVL